MIGIGAAMTAAADEGKRAPSSTVSDLAVLMEKQELERRAEELASQKQDRGDRKTVLNWVCIVCTCWLVFVGYMLLLSSEKDGAFKLSDRVAITLMSVTTAKILGLAWLVTKYLFHPIRIVRRKSSSGATSTRT